MPDLLSVFLLLAALIALGFLLARRITLDLKTVASLAIYGFTPIVGFGAAAQLDISASLLLLPLVTFCLAACVGLVCFRLGKGFLKQDSDLAFLLPVATGSGNTGYFGLPLAIALLGNQAAGIYLLANLGVVIFESTLGYYFVMRGGLTTRAAIGRVIKLPLLYALAAGLLFAGMQFELPAPAMKLWELAKGAYVCIGMMILGVALGQQRGVKPSIPFTVIGLTGKFLLWPLLAITLVTVDRTTLMLFDNTIHSCIILLSLAPMAANLAAFAAQSGARVDQAATLVLLSTIIAVIGLPFVLPLLF